MLDRKLLSAGTAPSALRKFKKRQGRWMCKLLSARANSGDLRAQTGD